MKQTAKDYLKSAEKKALASFSGRGTTLEQVTEVAELAKRVDSCFAFCSLTLTALKSLKKGYRALIYEIYIKNADKKSLAERYGVSLSKLYRLLNKAKAQFCFELKKLDCSEDWFWKTYGGLEWVSRMGNYVAGHSGRMPR